jgi:tetratricopeptide (TPR) repeat protein
MKAITFLLWCCSIGAVCAQPTSKPTKELVEEGVSLYDEGKYAEAVVKYQEALAAAPGDEGALSELALTYNSLGRNAEAVAICEKLIKANPGSDASVYVTIGNSLDALKKPKEAVRMYEQGLKHHPTSYALHFNKGVTLATSRDVPASISSFQRAVALNPQHGTSHLSLGLMQLGSDARGKYS